MSTMIPYDDEMYPDAIVMFRATHVTGGPGSTRPTYPTEGVASRASVQSQRVDRTDAAGRIFSVSQHEVFTPANIGARTADKIEWTDASGTVHVLSAEAATIPKGIGDVTWCTYCVETR